MIADDDKIPQWLLDGEYELEYHLDTAALLQMCAPYASIAAISRVSGINQHQLSHYANGIRDLVLNNANELLTVFTALDAN